MEAKFILQPVFVVILLTVIVTVWMLITRTIAVSKLKIRPQMCQDASILRDILPKNVSRIANNYNHLFEQPTLFYALAIIIALLDHVDLIHVSCAWVYAILRITHSIIQTTIDYVMARFSTFVLSWGVLIVMTTREAFFIF